MWKFLFQVLFLMSQQKYGLLVRKRDKSVEGVYENGRLQDETTDLVVIELQGDAAVLMSQIT